MLGASDCFGSLLILEHAGKPLVGRGWRRVTFEDSDRVGSRGSGFETHALRYSHESVDYPDFAEKVGRAVPDGVAAPGILICGSGIGASVATNKIEGIRGGMAHDHYSAHKVAKLEETRGI